MDISAEIAAIQAASQGSELRQPLVGALNKLNSGSLPAVTASDAGKILKVGANGWEVGEKSGYVPVPTASLNISSNDTYDVTNYAEAIVNVSGGGGGGGSVGILLDEQKSQYSGGTISIDKTVTIPKNGTYTIIVGGYCYSPTVKINNVVQSLTYSNNGAYVFYYDDEVSLLKDDVISISVSSTGSSYLRALIFANNDSGLVLVPKTITQNGTYNPANDNADGYSAVTVNVSGGGGGGSGTNSIYVSSSAPSANDGNINDLWLYHLSESVNDLEANTLTREYTIEITTAARGTNYNFIYYGARELAFVFDDGNGNDVLMQDIGTIDYSGYLNKTYLFNKDLSYYSESSGLPAVMTFSLTVPAGYSLKEFKVGWRNDSSYKDFWRDFTLTEAFIYNGVKYTRKILDMENMVVDQWDVGEYVDFTNSMVFSTSATTGMIRSIKLQNGWTTIQSLDEYLNYV